MNGTRALVEKTQCTRVDAYVCDKMVTVKGLGRAYGTCYEYGTDTQRASCWAKFETFLRADVGVRASGSQFGPCVVAKPVQVEDAVLRDNGVPLFGTRMGSVLGSTSYLARIGTS